MNTAPPELSTPRTWPAWTGAVLVALVLAAGEPLVTGAPTFSAGYVMRRMALALATGLLLLMAAWLPSRLQRPSGRGWLWLVAPLGIVLLGLLTITGSGAREVVRHGIVWAALATLPFALARALEIPKAARRTWMLVIGVGGVLALCGLYEAYSGGRVAASFGRAAVAGSVFGALLMPAALLVRHRGLAALGAVAMGCACVASGSRAAVVAAVLGALLATSIATTNRRVGRRLFAMGAAFAAVLVVWIGLGVTTDLPMPGSKRTVDVRLGLYRGALTLVGERPITGHGLGQYESEALRVRDVEEARLEPGRRPEHAHQDLLHVSTEGGLGAGLLLLGWLIGAFVLARSRLRDADPIRRRHVAAVLGVLTTLSVAGLADGILIDPGPTLLAALAVASLLTMGERRESARPTPTLRRIPIALAGLAVLAAALLLRADVSADAQLMRYVNARVTLRRALATGKSATVVERARAEAHDAWVGLKGAFVLRSDDPELWYQHAVGLAEEGDTGPAARSFRRAFDIDPGKTEARLDLARLMEIDGRIDDARAVLMEATRRDPTRFDVWMRLGHLEIGDEPIPGDPLPDDIDWVAALGRYNRARLVAPERFEYDLALARMDRRKASSPDELAAIDIRLGEIAGRFAPKDAKPLERFARAPAEVMVEGFRMAEARGAGEGVSNALLRLAMRKDPDVAILMRREADRLLAAGQRREDAAKEKVKDLVDPETGDIDPSKFDPKAFASADRAFGAAAVRLAALLQEGGLDVAGQLAQARGEKELRRYRMSLARYRGLLAAVQDQQSAARMLEDPSRAQSWRADLLREAAIVAQKIDAARARSLWTRSFTVQAEHYLRQDELPRALALLKRAIENYDAEFADSYYVLARVQVRLGATDEAAAALVRALELGPHWKLPAAQEPDFADIRKRPEVLRALKR